MGLSASKLVCTTCKNGYKLNSERCDILDEYKVGCNGYDTTGSFECNSCENRFYLATNKCE